MATTKDLIRSDMIKLGLGTYVDNDENFVSLENFFSGVVSKPLTYYGSIENAVEALKKQNYGRIEIPPQQGSPLCFLTINPNSEGSFKINIVTFGTTAPVKKNRPYNIDGAYEWQVGDFIYNTDFFVNRCLGWVCTSPAVIEENIDSVWEMVGNLDESKDKTTFTLIPYGDDLPAANERQLSKFILHSDNLNSDYHLYYCTRHFEQNPHTGVYYLKYKWKNVSENESLFKRAEMIYQYDGWQITSIENLKIHDNDETYLSELPKVIAVYTTVPVSESITPSEIQTVKVGRLRYNVCYSNREPVYEGDIPSGIPLVLFFNFNESFAYLPYVKPKEIDLPLVSVLPQASIATLGKRVLFQNPALEDFPSLYYCTQVYQDDTLTYVWIKPADPKVNSQTAVLEVLPDKKWNIVSIGEYSSTDSNLNTKINETLILTAKTPSDCVENQSVMLNGTEYKLRYLDGSYLKTKDIVIHSILSFQLDRRRSLATISSTPPPIPFKDKTVVKVASSIALSGGVWKIISIGDYQVDESMLFKSELPEKLALIIQAPSTSVDNQRVEIGLTSYALNYINGVPVKAGEIESGTVFIVQGSLISNKFYLPAFPSAQAQINADFTATNNRINNLNNKLVALTDDTNDFKTQTSSQFQITNQSVSDLRNSIEDIVSVKFAPLNSPSLSGTPTAVTPEQGDSSNRIATTRFVMSAVANLITSSPSSLNTLSELAQAVNNDPNFAATMLNSLAGKLDKIGGTVTNTLNILNTNDVSVSRYNSPALVLGGQVTAEHTELGVNKIQAKSKENAAAVLYLNEGGGLVLIGSGGLQISGDVVISGKLQVSGNIETNSTIVGTEFTGNAKTATTALNIPTEDIGGNIWIEQRN